MNETKLGIVKIYCPDEIISYFYISQDFVSTLNVETNDEALKLIRRKLRENIETKIYKRIEFDCESDAVIINVNKSELILEIAIIINQMANQDISEFNKKEVENFLSTYKRPKKQKWKKGSVFTVQMKNNSFVLAQILVKFSAYSVLCALYEKPYTELSNVIEDLEISKPKFLVPIQTINLDDHTYKVVGEYPIFFKLSNTDISEELRYSAFYSSILIELAEALNGISSFQSNHQEVIELQHELLKGK